MVDGSFPGGSARRDKGGPLLVTRTGGMAPVWYSFHMQKSNSYEYLIVSVLANRSGLRNLGRFLRIKLPLLEILCNGGKREKGGVPWSITLPVSAGSWVSSSSFSPLSLGCISGTS